MDGGRALGDLAPHGGKVAGGVNAVDTPVVEDRRDMQFAVILDSEQITMRQQERQANRIFPQPEAGDEYRRLDAALDQCRGDPFIESTRTGIEGQGDHQATRRRVTQPHARLDRHVARCHPGEPRPCENGWSRQQVPARQAEAAHRRAVSNGGVGCATSYGIRRRSNGGASRDDPMTHGGTGIPAELRISFDTAPSVATRAALSHEIDAYNARTMPQDARRFALLLHDESSRMVAGLSGVLAWQWLFVEALWVSDAWRHRGIGRALLAQAEAQVLGARLSWRLFTKALVLEVVGKNMKSAISARAGHADGRRGRGRPRARRSRRC